jgi:mycothiol synthase
VNAAAFASHAEQGRWSQRDLAARIAEPWFDATGFLLAVRDGELLGYHWTKIHPDGLGEVYVLGTAPSAQKLGLGRALLVRGLHYLADRGCPDVLLYVDGDNTGARRLYERSGFTEYDVDVQWRLPASSAESA